MKYDRGLTLAEQATCPRRKLRRRGRSARAPRAARPGTPPPAACSGRPPRLPRPALLLALFQLTQVIACSGRID